MGGGGFCPGYGTVPLGFEGSSKDVVCRTIAVLGAGVANVFNIPRKKVPDRVARYQQVVTFAVRHADLHSAAASACARSRSAVTAMIAAACKIRH